MAPIIIEKCVQYIVLFLTAATLAYAYFLHDSNQKNFLRSLLADLNQIAKDSESYKEVFIRSIIPEMKNNQDKEIRKEIIKIFGEYLDEKFMINKDKLQEKIKGDTTISKNLKEFAKNNMKRIFEITIHEEEKQELLKVMLNLPEIPQYKIHQVDYEFYAKNIDLSLPLPKIGKSTIILKRKILGLKRHINVMNFQVDKLNKTEFLPHIMMRKRTKEEEELRMDYLIFWHRYHNQVCQNIFTLDVYIHDLYFELNKFIRKIRKEEIENIIPILKREYLPRNNPTSQV